MSTNRVIGSGPSFKLFVDGWSEETLFLRLNDAEFTATNKSVIVAIPATFWEALRRVTAIPFDLLEVSDEEIERRLGLQADKFLKEYHTLVGGQEKGQITYVPAPMWVDNEIEAPGWLSREELVALGVEYYAKKKAFLRALQIEIQGHDLDLDKLGHEYLPPPKE